MSFFAAFVELLLVPLSVYVSGEEKKIIVLITSRNTKEVCKANFTFIYRHQGDKKSVSWICVIRRCAGNTVQEIDYALHMLRHENNDDGGLCYLVDEI